MKNLNEYKEEIFRRSQNRISARKIAIKKTLSFCIPTCLTLVVCSAAVLPRLFEGRIYDSAQENAAIESIESNRDYGESVESNRDYGESLGIIEDGKENANEDLSAENSSDEASDVYTDVSEDFDTEGDTEITPAPSPDKDTSNGVKDDAYDEGYTPDDTPEDTPNEDAGEESEGDECGPDDCGPEDTPEYVDPLPAPDDFAFSLVWDCYGVASYDSESGRLVKTTDATNPEDYATTLELTKAQLDVVYTIITKLEIQSYPESYNPHPDGFASDPPMTLILSVTQNGETKTIAARNIAYSFLSEDANGQRFLSICNQLIHVLTDTDEWNSLPEYEHLYA